MIDFPISINGCTIMSNEIYKYIKNQKIQAAIDYIIQKSGCSEEEAKSVVNDIIDMRSQIIDSKRTIQRQQIQKPENDIITCPKCGSTTIATTARGFSFLFGAIGADKTVNRCGKCGYTWKPKL